jgi:hypothetical protein
MQPAELPKLVETLASQNNCISLAYVRVNLCLFMNKTRKNLPAVKLRKLVTKYKLLCEESK